MFQLGTEYCITCRLRGDEVQVCRQGGSKAGIKGKNLVSFVHSYPGFGVFSNAFFEEICFPLEADHFHPFEQVADFVVSLVAEGNQELVGAELDVVTHHGRVCEVIIAFKNPS